MTTPPLRPEDLAELDHWSAAVARGEVTPREVAERVRDLVAVVRSSLVRPVSTLASESSPAADADLIDVAEAARLLDCRGRNGEIRPGRVYELKDDKVIPPDAVVRVGARLKFRRSRLQAWLDAGGTVNQTGGARA